MVICGIKASQHDGGIAVIDGDELRFSIEVEKLENRPRFSPLDDLRHVESLLRAEGVEPSDIDTFVVDGWWAEQAGHPPAVSTSRDGESLLLPVADYYEKDGEEPIRRLRFTEHDFGSREGGYASYTHAAGHVMAAYTSSPFAVRGESALVLVWDGGMTPRLYQVDPQTRTVRLVVSLLPLLGNIFGDFCGQFEPFFRDTSQFDFQQIIRHHLSVAGKAMAYAALGTSHREVFAVFDRLIAEFGAVALENAFVLGRKLADERKTLVPGLSGADIIATFQDYLGQLLVEKLAFVVQRRFPRQLPNLCLGGGCALNIKWNSALRDTGLFQEIWVPPFPNDSGAALGAAACELWQSGGTALEWNVYSGPRATVGELPPGWRAADCDERELARILHEEGEPVVVLSGRAEIGPRALGNRSIIAPATDPAMKDRLNLIKDRAGYRPVAPICVTARAAEVFTPGGADPYMLFEHRMRDGWAERVPAIVHLDGTARLQTIDPSDASSTGAILSEYEKVSGVPVLCNTSANLNGHGFFADVASAAKWGRTKYVWSDGRLFTNPDPTLGGIVAP